MRGYMTNHLDANHLYDFLFYNEYLLEISKTVYYTVTLCVFNIA